MARCVLLVEISRRMYAIEGPLEALARLRLCDDCGRLQPKALHRVRLRARDPRRAMCQCNRPPGVRSNHALARRKIAALRARDLVDQFWLLEGLYGAARRWGIDPRKVRAFAENGFHPPVVDFASRALGFG